MPAAKESSRLGRNHSFPFSAKLLSLLLFSSFSLLSFSFFLVTLSSSHFHLSPLHPLIIHHSLVSCLPQYHVLESTSSQLSNTPSDIICHASQDPLFTLEAFCILPCVFLNIRLAFVLWILEAGCSPAQSNVLMLMF